ncbi:MAG: methylenetetrahydrofolate reductase, partial [Candidatus Aenigmarchaeota archaeon]|nr:methylenetetrahydrofolate reductase [Candidatus Aenigmarchaeota archaeon]
MAKDKIFSNLMKEIVDGKFVLTGELEPVKEGNIEPTIDAARRLKGHVVACNVTDNPQSFGYVNSIMSAFIVQTKTRMECIAQMRCSDRNRLALLSDVLGAGLLGVRNVLAITGDYVSLGDNSGAKPVYDLDSTTLTHMISRVVKEGKDLNGNDVKDPPELHIAVAANPGAEILEVELYKLKR